jgi:hypothetical protein
MYVRMNANDDTLIPTAKLRQRYGDVSHMWVVRRLADDPSFPRPIFLAGRRYWRLADLIAWERSAAAREKPRARRGVAAVSHEAA